MSESSRRGKTFEQQIASILRKKLGARVTRDRRSGAGHHKADIRDYYGELPFHIEAKDQETIKIKEWMRQAIDSALFTQIPTLVFRMDEEIIAAVPFTQLVDLALEVQQLRAEVETLRAPVPPKMTTPEPVVQKASVRSGAGNRGETASRQMSPSARRQAVEGRDHLCRNGHMSDNSGVCLQKGCPYGRGYRKPKGKAR